MKHANLNLIWIFSVLMSGCDFVADDWQKATATNTAEAYRAFVRKHPQSEYTKDARSKGEGLAWSKAVKEKTIAGYTEYLKYYPDNTHTSEMYVPFSKDWFLPPGNTEHLKNAKFKFYPMRIKGSGPEKTVKNDKNRYVFMPVKGYVVSGELKTSLGLITKKAKFGSWQYVYTDSSKAKIIDYATCVVSGEMILPMDFIAMPFPANGHVDNKFTAKLLNDSSVLLTFTSSKTDKLCFITFRNSLSTVATVHYDGTIISTGKGVFTRVKGEWSFSR